MNKDIVDDLKNLVNTLNDGKEGYLSSSEVVNNMELKTMFLQFAEERATYVDELKMHINAHGGESDNEAGGILGALHRTWIDVKQALSSNEDEAVLSAIETGEQAAIEKYDKVLEQHGMYTAHIGILQKHRAGILDTLKQVETYHSKIVR